MKKNTYYLITSIIVFIVALIIYASVCYGRAPAMLVVTMSIIVAATTIFILRSRIDDALVTDELISKINEKAATRSLQLTWIIIFASTIANLSVILSTDDAVFRIKLLHMAMPFTICLAIMLLIYAVFRLYYTDMLAGYGDDEE